MKTSSINQVARLRDRPQFRGVFVFYFALALLGCASLPIFAQQETSRPAPGSVIVPSQSDEGQSDGSGSTDEEPRAPALNSGRIPRTGFVRLWNFANKASANGLGVFLAQGSSIPPPSDRLWLGRGSRPGELRDYAEFEPGNFQLFVIPDASRQGAMVELPPNFEADSDNKLFNRVSLQLRAGDYQTVLLFDENDRLEARVLNDSKIQPKQLRMFNFTAEFRPDVRVISNNKSAVIAQDFEGESILAMPDAVGVVTLEVSYPTAVEGFVGRMNVECDFSGVRSCSLAIAYDRYGRLSARAVEDAPMRSD